MKLSRLRTNVMVQPVEVRREDVYGFGEAMSARRATGSSYQACPYLFIPATPQQRNALRSIIPNALSIRQKCDRCQG